MPSAGKVIKQVIADMRLNAHVGSWAWLLHRVTGLALLLYLFLHMWVLSSARGGESVFNARLDKVQTPLFHGLEIFLLASVVVHGLNGLRVTIADFFFLTKRQKAMFWAWVVLFIVLMVFIVATIVPRILEATS
ncbi:MAG: succinate dehydrogenase, cytochrome b556 subunit [Candidatus Eisenbacteria bacterium]|nr:succinate dehydrogenase, cytochrome b556 subunit [Candidatus Eisenbacteria bacterium]